MVFRTAASRGRTRGAGPALPPRAVGERHGALPSTGELDPSELDAHQDVVDEIVTLTEQLLGLEETAARQRVDAEHAASSRVVYLTSGVLGVLSALLLTLAVIFGWYSGRGVVLLVVNVVVAIGMTVVHAGAAQVGHEERRWSAVVALVLGVVAPWWLPWWAGCVGLLVIVGNGVFFLGTTSLGSDQLPSAGSG